MRVVAFILVFLLVLCAAFVGYSMYAAELKIAKHAIQVLPAAQYQGQFDTLQRAGQISAMQGEQFSYRDLADSADYEFHLYTLTLKNNGFFEADWVELRVSPREGDVVQPTPSQPLVLPAFNTSEITATVLCDMGTDTPRTLTLTYYVLGRPYSISVQMP